MDGGIVDFLCGLAAAPFDEFLLHLVRVEARVVDLGVIDRGAPIGHPVGDELRHPRAVLNPDGDGVPEAAHLLAFAARRPPTPPPPPPATSPHHFSSSP